MRLLKVFACLTLLASTMLWAQPKDDIQERLKANEERIKALESEIKELKATLAAVARNVPAAPVLQGGEAQEPPPTQLPPTPQAVPTTPTLPGESAGQIPVYGGSSAAAKALNPDISVIGDFLGSIGRNPLNPVPTLEMHESEVGFQAIVDPYARADFFFSFGEEGVNLEEGFLTFTSLPAGLIVRAGKMRAAFGKVNTLHNHVLPWTDRPLVTGSLVGGEDGINDAGLSVTRILPAPRDILLEGTMQVFRGDSADVFKSSRNRDVSLVGHLRGYRDLTESTNLDLGLSYARGHNELGSGFLTQLYGISPASFTTTITQVRSDGFTVATKFDDSTSTDQEWACKPEGLVALSLGTGQTALGLSLQGIKADLTASNPSGLTLPAKVEPGMKWPYGLDIEGTLSQGTLAADVKGTVSTAMQAVGTESVTVPAGTFDAMKIDTTSTITVSANYHGLTLPLTSTIDTIFWFAPGVGWIKSAETGEVLGTSLNSITELESYNIP